MAIETVIETTVTSATDATDAAVDTAIATGNTVMETTKSFCNIVTEIAVENKKLIAITAVCAVAAYGLGKFGIPWALRRSKKRTSTKTNHTETKTTTDTDTQQT